MPKVGKEVRVFYRGRLQDGTVFDSNLGKEPLEFTLGAREVITGFDRAVQEMRIGEHRTVTIKPLEGYGDYREDAVKVVPLELIPNAAQLPIGRTIWFRNQKGQPFSAVVTKIQNGKATIDCNHHLAGKTLIFDIELVDVEGGDDTLEDGLPKGFKFPTMKSSVPGMGAMPTLDDLRNRSGE